MLGVSARKKPVFKPSVAQSMCWTTVHRCMIGRHLQAARGAGFDHKPCCQCAHCTGHDAPVLCVVQVSQQRVCLA